MLDDGNPMDCPHCDYGEVTWQHCRSDDGRVVEAGPCSSCGQWALRCPNAECSETIALDVSDTCPTCNLTKASTMLDRSAAEVEKIVVDDRSYRC